MSHGTPKTPSIKKAQAASVVAKAGNHGPFQRITGMIPERLQQVDSMLPIHPPSQIAEVMQVDWGESTDIARISLTHLLERYRSATVPPDKILNPYMVSRLTQKVRKTVNVLNEMMDLIELERERLRFARLEELEKGVLTPATDKQIVLMNRLLRGYSDLAYKAGLIDMFTADFKRAAAEEEADLTVTLEQIYWQTMRRLLKGESEQSTQLLLGKLLADD